MNKNIQEYNDLLSKENRALCELLMEEINAGLPGAESKIWHGSPVWFLVGNPIVGYSKQKDAVQLLFWSGQSFDDDELKPTGKFKAAEARYTDVDQVNTKDLKRWLKKAEQIRWDYKNIVKHKGVLKRVGDA